MRSICCAFELPGCQRGPQDVDLGLDLTAIGLKRSHTEEAVDEESEVCGEDGENSEAGYLIECRLIDASVLLDILRCLSRIRPGYSLRTAQCNYDERTGLKHSA